MDHAQEYARRIMNDDLEDLVSETPGDFADDRLERRYVFQDGAVVSYEWQSPTLGGFNHRFTLVKPPSPNPHRLKAGEIITI